MKRFPPIDEVDLSLLDLSLRGTFRTHGKTLRHHQTVLVRIRAGETWGEGEAYSLDPQGVLAVLEELPLAGRDPWEIEPILGEIGEPAARSAVDLALHDLLGKTLGIPVHRLLGLRRTRRPSCVSIGVDEPEVMLTTARRWIESGHPILKIKLTTTSDLSVVEEIRRLGGPGLKIWVDANQAYEPEQAIEVAERLVSLDVEIFEQPLAVGRLDAYASIRQRIGIPIVLDEEIRSPEDVALAAKAGGVDGINVKLAKIGGIRDSLRAIRVARAHGLGILIGCYFESSLGIAGSTQLLALVDRVDLDAPLFLENDPYDGLRYDLSSIEPPDSPGLGVRRH